MLRIIYDMLQCQMEPAHKRLYIKAKTLELLALQLLQLSESSTQQAFQTNGVKPAWNGLNSFYCRRKEK